MFLSLELHRVHCAGDTKQTHMNPITELQAFVYPMPPTVGYSTSSHSVPTDPPGGEKRARGARNHPLVHHSTIGESSRAHAILMHTSKQHDCRSPTSRSSAPRLSPASLLCIMAHLIVDVHLSRATIHSMICSVSRPPAGTGASPAATRH